MKNKILTIILVLIVLSLTHMNPSHAWPIPDSGIKCNDGNNESPCPQVGKIHYEQDSNYLINEISNANLNKRSITTSERQILIDLYNTIQPNVYDTWKKEPLHTDNFAMPGTECTWEGITCDTGGNYILEINLQNKYASGNLPDSIKGLAHLRSLNVSGNYISSIPESISDLTELEQLNLNHNSLMNTDFLASLKQLQKLIILELSNCNLSTSDLLIISEMTQLEYLVISNNSLDGKVFEILSNLSQLQTLFINDNNFGGQLPDNFSLPKLHTLDASNNEFSGTIPSGIQQLTNLIHLNLSNNSLYGAIPSEIAFIRQLESLQLDRNQLTGELPDSLMNLTNLKNDASDISFNSLYTNNSQLSSYLDSKQTGNSWIATQTLTVTDLSIGNVTDTSVTLFWAQVSDTFPNGGLEISYAKDGETFVPINPLRPKLDQEFTITGLLPSTQYQFRIRNITDSHDNNNNKIYSEYSSIVTATTTGTTPTLNDYVSEGRKYLSIDNLTGFIHANKSFENALEIQPDHEESHFFNSITRFGPLLDLDNNYTSGMPIDNLRELLDVYGISQEGRDIDNWFADFQRDAEWNIKLPNDSPSLQEVIDYFHTVWTDEIHDALYNLDHISSSFNTIIKREEIGDDATEDVEIDYGEVLLYKSALYAFKGMIYVITAYDFDVQYVAELMDQLSQDLFHINTSLLDRYEQLFTLVSGNETQISDDAKISFLLAIDTYFEAYNFITAETDDQSNDLMAFDPNKPENEMNEKAFRDHLTAFKDSLENGTLMKMGNKDNLWELTTNDNLGGTIYLRITTDAYDNFDYGDWHSSATDAQASNFIGYGGSLDELIQKDDYIQLTMKSYFWRGYNTACNLNLQFNGNVSIGSMDGTYTGTVCGEIKSGTFNGTYIQQEQDIQEVNVGEFFDDPISPREYIPKLTQNPYTDDILINGMRTYKDRTYSDIYPAGIPEDIVIDHMSVYGINTEQISFLMFNVMINELAPWMINKIQLSNSEEMSLTPVNLFFNPGATIYGKALGASFPMNDHYGINIEDINGKVYSKEKSFTYNELPITELIQPVDKAYVNSTTPTFTWQAVMDDQLGNQLYYQVVIFTTDNNPLYCSDPLTQNEFTMPQGILEKNVTYTWQVIVIDGPDSVSMNNMSVSSARIIFTGASQTMTIEQAAMLNIKQTDTTITRIKLKLTGISKVDIQRFEITGPESRSFELNYLFLIDMPDGSFYWDTTEMPSGAYTLSVVDNRNSDIISTQISLTTKDLESPSSLGLPNQSIITTTMPTLTWDAVAGISSYQVQIMDFTGRVVYESPVTSQTQFTVPKTVLKEYEPYQWQVLSLDAADTPNNMAQSEKRRFYVSRMNNILSLSLPSNVNETDSTMIAVISVPENLNEDLTVQLTVEPSNNNIVTIPTSAIISGNSKSCEVEIQINDNSTADGDQQISINVSAPGYFSSSQSMTVIDDDTAFNPEERTALISLYNSTNGDDWTDNSGWNGAEGTECNWYGITCIDDHIAYIYLNSNNLTGELPHEISGLTSLIELYLPSNNISGEIPSEIGQLKKLEVIDLANNHMTGSIPHELETLSTLYQLNLANNELSGSIPETLFTLSNLSSLDLSHNHISGNLPDNIGNLSNLFSLNISANKIQGSIPTSITNLQQLYDDQTDIQYNALYSNNSDVIDFLNNLWSNNEWQQYQTIAPSNIRLNAIDTDSVQIKWDAISYMADGGYEIWYSTNENGPYTIGTATGAISDYTGSVDNLNEDTLYYFKIKTFTLSHANNHNRVESEFSYWISVRTQKGTPPELIALYNSTNGDNWTDKSNWNGDAGTECTWYGIHCENDKVVAITLTDNNLIGQIPSELFDLTELTTLELSENRLNGSIPSSITQATRLVDLDLSDNQLNGDIPPEVYQLPALETLNLANNQFSGQLSSAISNLTQLREIYLNHNAFTGEIPLELCSLSNLITVFFQHNSFEGSIPSCIGNLSSLYGLDLSSNMLSGSIPESIINLTGLNAMFTSFSYNALYTNIADLISFLNNIDSGWDTTQTIAPENVDIVSTTRTSISLSWQTIPFVSENGGYEIWTAISEYGPFNIAASTGSKYESFAQVENLNINTLYYLKVRTCTSYHTNNPNYVCSEFSNILSAKTESEKYAPVVSNIPDQVISKFQAFSSIALDNFISDVDHEKSEISWQVNGESALKVSINNRIAEISVIDTNWTGTEIIEFTATDPDMQTSSDIVSFTIKSVKLNLSMDTTMNENQGTGYAAVFLDETFSQDLIVNMSSTDTSEVTVPATVIIPANSYSVEFDLIIVNDSEVDGTQTAVIQASAPGWEPATHELIILDDDYYVSWTVTDIPDQSISKSESFGSIVLDNYISGMSHSLTEITWTVSGESAISVEIHNRIAELSPVDSNWTGSETLVFIATDSNGISASDSATFTVSSLQLYLSMGTSFKENESSAHAAVYLYQTYSDDLVVNLSSSDSSEVNVPSTVTIPKGEYSVDFNFSIVNDSEIDGAQTVIIQASASGWESASQEITILDDEVSNDSLIAEGRKKLSQHNQSALYEANASFKEAVSKDPGNPEANFFLAITRLISLLNTDELSNLANSYGISQTGRDIFDWTAEFQKDPDDNIELPANSPSFNAVQSYLLNHLLPEIDASLANLSKINNTFTTIITNDESGDYLDKDVEIDYGDVLALGVGLHVLKSAIYIVCAYDMNADIDELFEKIEDDIFDMNVDLLDKYQNFLNLLTGGDVMISVDAKSEFLKAIDLYYETSEFIRNETDDQSDDAISIDDDTLNDETEFRGNLAKIEDSINETVPVTLGEIETDFEESWRIETQSSNGSHVKVYWRIVRDEFNSLKQSDYSFEFPCINNSYNGCHGDIVTYKVSGDILNVQGVSSDGSSISFTGTLNAAENAIVSGTYIATYNDYYGKNTDTGSFTGNMEYSEMRVEDNTLTINVGEIFNDAIHIRAYLPEFTNDPYNNDVLVISENTFPDRTFSGIFPEKVPTKGDVFIDKLSVKGSYNQVKVLVGINGLADWDVQEIYCEDPKGKIQHFSIEPFNTYLGGYLLYRSTYYQTTAGEYNVYVIDKEGNKFSKSKLYTYNEFIVPSSNEIFPENGAFVETTTPTLSWQDCSSTLPVSKYYLIQVLDTFNPLTGQKIHNYVASKNSFTFPEGALQLNKRYRWRLYVRDHADHHMTNNIKQITDRTFYTYSPTAPIQITDGLIRTEHSSNGIQTLIDLETIGWTGNDAISTSGPLTNIMTDRNVDHASERAYSIVSGAIPDGSYTFSIEKDGKMTSYTIDYAYRELPIAMGLTVSNIENYIYTTMPKFSWSPTVLDGEPLHSSLQVYQYKSDNLVYESPVSLETQTTIPANILQDSQAYRYRVMVYDNPESAKNVSVTDFQRIYVTLTSPQLFLNIPATVYENDGTLFKQGTLSVNKSPAKDLVVTLSASDNSEIIIPTQLTIPKGQTSVQFNISIIDDDILDSAQTVMIKADADGWSTGNTSIEIIDNDEDWKTIELPFSANHIDFNDIWGTGEDNIFVVGSPAMIVHFDGYNWEIMSLPPDLHADFELYGIHGTDSENIIAVGSHTTALKYDGSQWTSLTSTQMSGQMLYDVWISGEDIHAVGDIYLSYENDIWTKHSKTYEPFYSIWGTIEVESGNYTQTNLYTTGSTMILKNFMPESIDHSNTYQSIFGIDDQIYAVGGNEIIQKINGQWSVLNNSYQQSNDFYTHVWASASNDILVSGTSGTILNRIDNEWKRMQTGTEQQLNAIWGSSEKDVYAVGKSGTILRARPRNIIVNHPPNKPIAVTPEHETTISVAYQVELESASFSDPDGDRHQKTLWRVRRADQSYYCPNYTESFNTVVENIGTVDMTNHTITDLMSGMKYYWQVGYVDDSDGQSGISWSDEFSFKVGEIVTDEDASSIPPGEEVEDYRMISFPFWLKTPDILSLIQMDTINTETNKIGTYLPSRSGYIEGNTIQIEPGRAYWFLSRKGLELDVTGVQVNTSETIEVPLWYNPSTGNGWNMIGTPNNKTYSWGSISIIVYDDLGNIVAGPYNVLSKEAGKYIDPRLWEWEDGSYEDNEEEIQPYEGYWVRARASYVSLQFPVDGTVSHTGKSFMRYIKEMVSWLTPSSLQATSSDSPPMPMGLSRNADVSEDKCFIGVLADEDDKFME